LVVVNEGTRRVVEMVELGFTVGLLAPFGHLGVGLERVTELVQKEQHRA
jgi:hypothetical protein